MKLFRCVSAAACFALLSVQCAGASVPNDAPPPAPLTFSDGSVATPLDHCGDADLCATIAYPNGDSLLMYSGGAALCQPYTVHFVRVHGGATLFEYSRPLNHDIPHDAPFGGRVCGNTQATRMTFDHGLVHLTVDEYKDGSLRFVFTRTGAP